MSDRLSEIEERLAATTPGPWEQSAYLTDSGERVHYELMADGLRTAILGSAS